MKSSSTFPLSKHLSQHCESKRGKKKKKNMDMDTHVAVCTFLKKQIKITKGSMLGLITSSYIMHMLITDHLYC